MLTEGQKTCARCGEEKPADGNFYRVRRKTGDGFHAYCIPCVKVAAIAWQRANPEKKRESDRKKAAKRPKKGRFRKYFTRETLLEARRAQGRAYMRREPAKTRHRLRERLRRATLSWQVYDGNRRVARVRLGGEFTLREWTHVLTAFGGRCAYCGTAERKMTIEHLTPLTRGGLHAVGNIAPACKPCNSRKRDKTVEEYAAVPGVAFDAEGVRQRAAPN